MRLLIDGYNVMHAAGLMSRRFGPDGLRQTRHRFLNTLADALGPDQAAGTTVVFDATSLPRNQAAESSHKKIRVIFAIDDEDADSRIELFIARHSTPRTLTVVSTDRRLRRAAQRRRARSLTSDEFLSQLGPERSHRSRAPQAPSPEERARLEGPSADEVAAWVLEFEAADEDLPSLGMPRDDRPAWTDDDLDRIAREVEREFSDVQRLSPRRRRC